MAPKHFKSKPKQEPATASSKPSSAAKEISICTEEDPQGWLKLYPLLVLGIVWMVAFASRLYAVIRYEAIIHEFDPWFNYRASHYFVERGFYNFHNWFDERAWYPLGRIVGGTVYPGLMITSGFIHYVLYLLNIPIFIRDICVFLAPLFSGLTAISTFLFTKELWNTGAGLFAAAFIGIAPGYISRSVAGSYDNEGIAIFALVTVFYLWLKSVGTGSIMWSSLTALAYWYMVSAWGGYVFIINLIPLHVFVLLLMGRYSHRLYVSYNTFFVLGLILSMQIPFVGFQPVRTSEHMAAIGVFAVLNALAFLKYVRSMNVQIELWLVWAAIAGVVFLAVVGLTFAGVIAPWSGRFYSLWDTGYAKIHIPIIASVSEHQPTTWTSYLFDLHFLIVAFPAGVYFCIKEVNDKRVLIVLYAVFATYFSGVMVRLVLTLTPVVCVLAGITVSEIWSKYSFAVAERPVEETRSDRKLFDELGSTPKPQVPKRVETDDESGIGVTMRNLVNFLLMVLLFLFVMHCTWITSNAYSSPSIVLSTYNNKGEREILDDFREAYYWLRMNTDDSARVMSWWDYGYQIAGMGNRTTLVDNNTWNNSHIAIVGKAMSSNESAAYEIMRSLDVDYVLVIFGGLIGYSGDDINKFLWMVRIAEGEHPKEIRESDYFTSDGHYRVDSNAPPTMLNCLMYRLSYYRFAEATGGFQGPSGYDRTRNTEIGKKNIKLKYLEEAFTSEHWLVRIYRVKKLENRVNLPLKSLRASKPANKLRGKTKK